MRQFYPAAVRKDVDFDYVARLPAAERVWLAAFAEEYYRGWRLKRETQLHSVEQLREADAGRKRSARALGGAGEPEALTEDVAAEGGEDFVLEALEQRRRGAGRVSRGAAGGRRRS